MLRSGATGSHKKIYKTNVRTSLVLWEDPAEPYSERRQEVVTREEVHRLRHVSDGSLVTVVM